MNLKQIRLVWGGATLLASAVAWQSAGAQIGPSGYVEDSGSALNRHLKDLANSPRSLSALLGAAKAALELGDPQAAVTFYARAEEVAPRDGRIKAGMGAAFLAMEQPAPALKFLEEARGLGLPEGVIAADRGLAHDLLGDPVQAQRDYAIAMRANDNDEVRRRLALSRAISGDRTGALAAIEDQVRRKSAAGWRVRAFVLALTGDAAGATEATRSVMPAQAAALQPFFARLPQLRPAERAMAVHFGHFPGDAPPGQMPAPLPNYAALPPNIVLGGRPDTSQPSLSRREPAGMSSVAGSSGAGQGTRLASRFNPPVRNLPGPSSSTSNAGADLRSGVGARVTGSVQGPPDGGTRPTATASRSNPTSLPSVAVRAPTPGISGIELPASASGSLVRSTAPSPAPVGSRATSVTAQSTPLPTTRPSPTEPARSGGLAGLASVAATIRALNEPGDGARSEPPQASVPGVAIPPAAQTAPSGTAPTSSTAIGAGSATLLARRSEIPAAAAKAPVRPASTRRFWVQIGGRPDEASLLAEFRRLKAKAPDLLGDKAAWTAPADASTSRLLIGPFKTREDSNLFVGLLDDEGLRATAWTSSAGQEIVKLAAK